MNKPLCIVSGVISVLVFLLFVVNLFAGVPFGTAAGLLACITMILGSGIIGAFSVLTYLEE